VADADGLVQDLGHGRQAVGRAGRVGDDVMSLGVVEVVVDAEHEVRVGRLGAFGGRGEDDLLRSGLQMALGVGARTELAGRFDHDVDAEVRPWEVGGVALRERADLEVSGLDDAVLGGDRAREATVDRVVGEEVGERGSVGDIVDGDDLDVGAGLDGRTHDAASDAAEAVDSYAGGHDGSFGSAFKSRRSKSAR
jgi:hypothetical protein